MSGKDLTWYDFKSFPLGGGLWLTQGFRIVAQRFAFIFYKIGLTPNTVSFISLIVTLGGLSILVLQDDISFTVSFLSVLVLWFGYILDCVDGQLARVTKSGSKYGEWLDHTLDCFSNFMKHFAAGYLILKNVQDLPEYWLIAFIALIINISFSGTYFFAWNMKTKIVGSNVVASEQASSSRKIVLMKLPLQLTDTVLFLSVFLLSYDTMKFMWLYLFYGMITALIYGMYLLVSGRSMMKLK